MRVLDRLAGNGALIIGGQEAGIVGYNITVTWDGRVVTGLGEFSGDRRLLSQAFSAPDVKLRLRGDEIGIVLTSGGSRGYEFETFGVIPGVDVAGL